MRVRENAEQLADAADEQALLVDLHPGAGGGREDDVVARSDGHSHADVAPPVEPLADGEDDAVLRRRLMRAGWDDQARLAHAVGLELLDDDAIEEGTQVLPHERSEG